MKHRSDSHYDADSPTVSKSKASSISQTGSSTQGSSTLAPPVASQSMSGSSGPSSGSKRDAPDDSTDGRQISSSKKVKIAADPVNAKIQCASYALELMSHGGFRSHVIGALVTDRSTLQLLYYDRSIVMQSTPLRFMDDEKSFIKALFGLACLNFNDWGHHQLLKIPHAKSISNHKPYDAMFNNEALVVERVKLKLGRIILHSRGLIGRGTCVVRAELADKCPDNLKEKLEGKALVVKLSWPAVRRVSEVAIIKKARGKAMSTHSSMVDHLPDILLSEDVQASALQQRIKDFARDDYEARILRIIVLPQYFPIIQLSQASQLAEAVRGIFKCEYLTCSFVVLLTNFIFPGYRWLYEVVEIHHRDISVNNLMYRIGKGPGDRITIYGILNDFDLSTDLSEGSKIPTSNQRTGTLPFMAVDLLDDDPAPHMYRHDLESLVYVLIYITACYANGKQIAGAPYALWNEVGRTAQRKEKKDVQSAKLKLTAGYRPFLLTWIEPLRKCLRAGYSIQAERVANDNLDVSDTLYGEVTFDKFEGIYETAVSNA